MLVEYAWRIVLCIIRVEATLSSADPVGLGGQSDLIGVPEPMSTEAVLGALFGRTSITSGEQVAGQRAAPSVSPAPVVAS